MPATESDFDGAWKEAFRVHLEPILEVYFPKIRALVDWSQPPEWLDKEMSPIIGKSGRRNRAVDLLVSRRLLSADDQWILLHGEIQGEREVAFAKRVHLYQSGLS